LAHLDFIPGSATGLGMTFGKLFPFPVLVFPLPLGLPLPALSKPSDALPGKSPPSPRRLHLTLHPTPQRGANSSSSEHQQVLHPPSARQSPPPPSPLPAGLSRGSFLQPVCKALNIRTSCRQLPAQKLFQGKSAPHMSLATGGVPWDRAGGGVSLSYRSWGPWWGEEVLQGEPWGSNPNDGSKLAPLTIQLLGGSKPAQTPQVSPTTVAQRDPTPWRVPIQIQPC